MPVSGTMFVRAGRLNMYCPDGALIVHPRRICMRASVRTDRSEDATACRARRQRTVSVALRPFILTGGRHDIANPFLSARAFCELRSLPRGA